MSEQNKAIARKAFEETANKANFSAAPELYDPGFVSHQYGSEEIRGHDGLRQAITIFHTAFPDLHLTVEDQVSEGDIVATRWTGRGTHQGDLEGIPPTGKQVAMTGIEIDRIVNGKIVEQWEVIDRMSLMQQLGVIPEL